MGRFTLTPRAEADLYEIWPTIAADNIPAADRRYHRVLHKVQLAAEHPHMGSPRPELSPTARILVEGRYIVVYEPQHDGVMVIAVVHGMRDPENWLG